MADLRLDAHKLIFHPCAVAKWLDGKNTYPICVEVALTNSCNHRCIFCSVDYPGYKNVFIDDITILNTLKTLSSYGTKSVTFAGEGEPLLNKNAVDIINKTKAFGLDVGLTTNGSLFEKSIAEACLPSLTWVRFSVAAATAETYSKIHQTKTKAFHTTLRNIETAVEAKRRNNLDVTLGVQLLLIPENADEVVLLGETLKKIGVDYYAVKPYSRIQKTMNNISPDYSSLLAKHNDIENRLKQLQTDNYKIYVRTNRVRSISQDRPYDSCHGLEFMTYIDSSGNVITCCVHLGNSEYCYGNIYQDDIIAIWNQRHSVINRINASRLAGCEPGCRYDEMNLYLNNLKTPSEHVNFI